MAQQKRKPGRPPGSKNKTKQKDSTAARQSAAAGNRLKDEIWSIVIMALGIFLVVSLQSKAAGQFGIAISYLLMGCFGIVAYILPYYLLVYGFLLFTKRTAHISGRSVTFLFLVFLMITLLNSAQYLGPDSGYHFSFLFIKQMFDTGAQLKTGGAFGMAVGLLLVKIIGMTGLYLLSIVVTVISIMLVINTPVSQFFDQMKLKHQMKKEKREEELSMQIDTESMEPVDFANSEVLTHHSEKTEHDFVKKNKKAAAVAEAAREAQFESPIETIVTDSYPVKTGLMSENQMKILDYMKNDDLFESDHTETDKNSLGLEEIVPGEPGMGLTGERVREEEIDRGNEKEKNKNTKVDSVSDQADTPSILEEIEKKSSNPPKLYRIPPTDLLSKGPAGNKLGENESLKAKAAKLEQTLHDFNVNAKVIQVTKGPAVTRYEIQPNTGVKVSSIVRLADDIALNLEAKSIRIEAPIPGKAAVGIEVENERVNLVTIREIIESVEFKSEKSKISFAVGKDIAGKAIVADLKSMPHMLIAGSTGSGKSVCINSIIISLLYKAKPEEVKFVLIDPKVVELGNYNGIPHLLIPVVTEPGKAAAALNWAVAEMTDRYKKFAEEGVRDLESFNSSVKKKEENDRFLPQIVIIIDELADLMMAAPSQVEESICRLAQMARAAGMHLIVATQRPSVDIITGVIKANIPSRIAFAVSSQFDSRTILDMAGAERLVGKGDMLFNPIGIAKPVRVQGTFISDSEVHKVIEYVKNQSEEVTYSDDVIHSIEKVQTTSADDDVDELLADAIETVVRAEQASVSMLQRRFRIGYNRAARLVDMMESRGIIGPADGSRPRRVLITEEELANLSGNAEEE